MAKASGELATEALVSPWWPKSSWTVGITTERNQNFHADVGPVWFATEATSGTGRCTVPGAYDGGIILRSVTVSLIVDSGSMRDDKSLYGPSFPDASTEENGW